MKVYMQGTSSALSLGGVIGREAMDIVSGKLRMVLVVTIELTYLLPDAARFLVQLRLAGPYS
jgi:hypothetical protein